MPPPRSRLPKFEEGVSRQKALTDGQFKFVPGRAIKMDGMPVAGRSDPEGTGTDKGIKVVATECRAKFDGPALLALGSVRAPHRPGLSLLQHQTGLFFRLGVGGTQIIPGTPVCPCSS
jgi:hypothetical protein